ncbi:hypothetical protein HYS48_00805 [Candidatus Woesearchaeota archaeon]|nr:hypothetical protein [Candidatus Woesearchaeota archaeon]
MAETVSIKQVYKELKQIKRVLVTKEDLERYFKKYSSKEEMDKFVDKVREMENALEDSIEIMNDPARMEAIQRSENDIKQGRVKKVTSAADLWEELKHT